MSKRSGSRVSGGGFTLVELLVVIGIIGVLVAILLPALSRAQRAARTVQCSSNMRSIIQAVQMYAGQYGGAFPGSPFTSSAHLRSSTFTAVPQPLYGRYTPPGVQYTPAATFAGSLSIFDWASPVLQIMRVNIPDQNVVPQTTTTYMNRLRFVFRTPQLRCPENVALAGPFPASPTAPILEGPSYATNIDFMLLRNDYGGTTSNTNSNGVGWFVTRTEWNNPQGYVPRLNKIGDPSRKAFLVEGTRFINRTTLEWTYNTDGQDTNQMGGSFTDQRMWCPFNNSKAPLGKLINPLAPATPGGDGKAVVFSFRHGNRNPTGTRDTYRMNVAFFDGHVETLNMTDAMNPEFHSPKGAQLSIDSSQAFQFVIDRYFNGRAGIYFNK